jgi:hypothetical protein
MSKKKARMGRPPKKARDRHDITVTVRLTRAEHRRLVALAKAEGLGIGEFIRRRTVGEGE